MYILVQGAVPKSNSAHCLLLLYFMFNCVNYSANPVNIFYFYQLFLLSMLIFGYTFICYHTSMLQSIQLIYKQYYAL